MTALIIPVCDIRDRNFKDLVELLSSIEAGGYLEECKVVIAFDSCEDDFTEKINEKFPWILGIVNTGNRLQFTKNTNNGIRFVLSQWPDEDVFIVNQDTILPHWSHLKQVIGEGISSPHTIGNDKLDDLNLHTGEREKVEKFAFYCVHISNSVLKKIGLLDGVFKRCFSDDDYVARASLAGFPVEMTNIKVYHKGSHIDTSQPGWESGSGCYNASTLGEELQQYLTKWQCRVGHDEAMKWILSNHVWQEEMKIC